VAVERGHVELGADARPQALDRPHGEDEGEHKHEDWESRTA
jgi:hypothetical protein